mgnify:CR=1 FL=1
MFVKVHKPVNTPCVCDNKDRCRAREEDAGCVLPDVPFHGESETGSHSGS